MTTVIMTTDATMPVNTKTQIITDKICPSRFKLLIEATVEEMEKNTSGIITVKSKFKKTSPSGLNTAAFSRKMNPKPAPHRIAAIKRIENP